MQVENWTGIFEYMKGGYKEVDNKLFSVILTEVPSSLIFPRILWKSNSAFYLLLVF